MIIEDTRLWFALFSKIFIQLTVGNRQVSQSQASENAVQVLRQSVDTWRCDSHHYGLPEAWYLVKPLTSWWPLLEVSAFDSHNTATATWGTFFGDFFSLPQTRALSFFIDWAVTALSTISRTSSLKGKIWTEIDHPTLSVSQGFESHAKYWPSCELATGGELCDSVLVYRSKCRHCHPLCCWWYWLLLEFGYHTSLRDACDSLLFYV